MAAGLIFRCVGLVPLLTGLLYASLAYAEPARLFEMGGLQWRVPLQYLVGPVPDPATAVTLRLPLPTEVQSKTPNEGDASLPFLTATISTAPLADAPILQKYEKNILHCKICIADSSLDGHSFSNYDFGMPPFKNGPPFELYVNAAADAPRFVVCHFDPVSGKPLQCEVAETIDAGKLFLDYRFPQEYITEVFAIDAALKALIGSFQSSGNPVNSGTAWFSNPPVNCWRPEPGSSGARVVTLPLGQQSLHIPMAYGSFGSYRPDQQNLNMDLTLPDLRPISPTDLSPLEMRGFYHYININITYDDDALDMHPQLTASSDMMSLFNDEHPVGESNILPYKMFMKYPGWYDSGWGELYYSTDTRKTFSTFPPLYFTCSSFVPAENADCEFDVVIRQVPKDTNKPRAGLEITYNFSKDYFAQVPAINRCLQQFIQSITN